MFQSIKEFREAQDKRRIKLEAEVRRLVLKLSELGAIKLILFGSLASGKITPWSDVDLLVIVPNHESSKEWRRIIYEDLERKVAVDVLVFTEEEYHANLVHSSLLQTIAQTGVLIYERK